MLNERFYIVSITLSIIFALVGLFFGLFILGILIFKQQTRSQSNILVCNLGMSNLCLSLIAIWNYAQALRVETTACAFRGYIFTTFASIVCYSFAAQAISRWFHAVLYKYRILTTSQMRYLLIVLSWIVPAALQLISFLFNGYGYQPESRLCVVRVSYFVAGMSCAIVGYIIPLSIVLIIYGHIVYRTRQMASHISTVTETNDVTRHAKRDVQIMRNLFRLLCIYIIFGSPYVILIIIDTSMEPPEALFLWSTTSIIVGTSLLTISSFWMNLSLRKIIFRPQIKPHGHQ